MNLSVHPYFAVPIAVTQVPDSGQFNQALLEKFLEWEKLDRKGAAARTRVDRHNVYESDFSLFRRDDPAIRRLARICLTAVGDIVKEVNRYSVQEMQALKIYEHSWYHVTRYGGYFRPHNHPMASWSGVYCVTPGSPSAAEQPGGVLHFLEARTTAGMYLDPGNAYMAAPYSFGDLSYPLQAGGLILFPSFLHHEVTPFWGSDVRVTVAFNCWLRYADQVADEPGIRERESGSAERG